MRVVLTLTDDAGTVLDLDAAGAPSRVADLLRACASTVDPDLDLRTDAATVARTMTS